MVRTAKKNSTTTQNLQFRAFILVAARVIRLWSSLFLPTSHSRSSAFLFRMMMHRYAKAGSESNSRSKADSLGSR